ncbi:hypothetical protein [Chitinibacter sp. S2-10]|uniref:hypothetical protein n=1 Tax=Chitinibacter sp. S2-10 TaxID=3373597 RepID=UPI0039777BB9
MAKLFITPRFDLNAKRKIKDFNGDTYSLINEVGKIIRETPENTQDNLSVFNVIHECILNANLSNETRKSAIQILESVYLTSREFNLTDESYYKAISGKLINEFSMFVANSFESEKLLQIKESRQALLVAAKEWGEYKLRIDNEIKQVEHRIETAIRKAREQALSTFESEHQQHNNSLARTKEEIEKIYAQSQRNWEETNKQQSNLLEAKSKEINEFISTSNNQFENLIRSSKDELSLRIENINSLKIIAEKNLEENKSALRDANQILGDIRFFSQATATVAMEEKFTSTAEKEAKTANIFRLITISIFGISMAIAIFTSLSFDPSNYHVAIVRLFTCIVLAAPAYYTAKESARHSNNSDQARIISLELGVLNPFINDIPQEQRTKIKETLVSHYFGKKSNTHTAEKIYDLEKILEILAGIVNKPEAHKEKATKVAAPAATEKG